MNDNDDDYYRLLELIDQSRIEHYKGGEDDDDKGNDGEEKRAYSDHDDSGKYDLDSEEEEETKYGDNAKSDEGQFYGTNKELIQAQTYDRTFILNGPIVKVYQNAEESGLGNVYDHQRLVHCLDLPAIKDQHGN